MGWACSRHGNYKKFMQSFSRKMKVRDLLENLDIDRVIIQMDLTEMVCVSPAGS